MGDTGLRLRPVIPKILLACKAPFSNTVDRFSWLQIKRQQPRLCSKHSLPSGITAGSEVAFEPLQNISLPFFFSQLCGVMLGFLCRRCVLLQVRSGARYTGDTNMTLTDMCLLWSATGTSHIHLCLSCL